MPSDRIVRINTEHDEIHEGDSYLVSLVDLTMADTETINFAFKTPNTEKYINLVIDWSALVAGHLELIEAPTWGNQTGTSVAIINRNRTSSNTSGLQHDLTDTVFATGSKISANVTTILTTNATIIGTSYVFGAVSNKGNNESRGRAEFILEGNTQYVIRLTADGGSNKGFLALSWYEHKANDI